MINPNHRSRLLCPMAKCMWVWIKILDPINQMLVAENSPSVHQGPKSGSMPKFSIMMFSLILVVEFPWKTLQVEAVGGSIHNGPKFLLFIHSMFMYAPWYPIDFDTKTSFLAIILPHVDPHCCLVPPSTSTAVTLNDTGVSWPDASSAACSVCESDATLVVSKRSMTSAASVPATSAWWFH